MAKQSQLDRVLRELDQEIATLTAMRDRLLRHVPKPKPVARRPKADPAKVEP